MITFTREYGNSYVNVFGKPVFVVNTRGISLLPNVHIQFPSIDSNTTITSSIYDGTINSAGTITSPGTQGWAITKSDDFEFIKGSNDYIRGTGSKIEIALTGELTIRRAKDVAALSIINPTASTALVQQHSPWLTLTAHAWDTTTGGGRDTVVPWMIRNEGYASPGFGGGCLVFKVESQYIRRPHAFDEQGRVLLAYGSGPFYDQDIGPYYGFNGEDFGQWPIILAGNIAGLNKVVVGWPEKNIVTDLYVTGTIYHTDAPVPLASDGAALGSTSLQWSDLFLASGGVVNFANGNYTLTHSSGLLTLNGKLTIGTGSTYQLNVESSVAGDVGVRQLLRNTSNSAVTSTILQLGNDLTNIEGGFFLNSSANTSYGGAGSLNLITIYNAPLALGTANAVVMKMTSAGLTGFGTDPLAKLHVQSNTEQLRCGCNGGNYLSTTVAGTGDTTWSIVSNNGAPAFTFTAVATPILYVSETTHTVKTQIYASYDSVGFGWVGTKTAHDFYIGTNNAWNIKVTYSSGVVTFGADVSITGTVLAGTWHGASISTSYTDAKCTATWPNTYSANQNLLTSSTPTFESLTVSKAATPIIYVNETTHAVITELYADYVGSAGFGWVGTKTAHDFYIGTNNAWNIKITQSTGLVSFGENTTITSGTGAITTSSTITINGNLATFPFTIINPSAASYYVQQHSPWLTLTCHAWDTENNVSVAVSWHLRTEGYASPGPVGGPPAAGGCLVFKTSGAQYIRRPMAIDENGRMVIGAGTGPYTIDGETIYGFHGEDFGSYGNWPIILEGSIAGLNKVVVGSPPSNVTAHLYVTGVIYTMTSGARGTAHQVVGAQQAAIANPTGGSVIDVECRAAMVSLLGANRTHGLIAT